MRIEINEAGSEAFCREVVHVIGQHRRLLKKPEAKLKNQMKGFKGSIILCAVLLVLNVAMAMAWGWDTLSWVAVVLMAVLILLNAACLIQYLRMVKGMMARTEPAVLTVDEDGVELQRGDQCFRLGWSSIAFARVFEESMCFVPGDTVVVLIAVDRRYASQVLETMHKCAPDVNVY
jgi:hypothetical protein